MLGQTQPTEGEEEGGGGSSAGASEQRARLLLLFVLALAYLANEYSKGRLPWCANPSSCSRHQLSSEP